MRLPDEYDDSQRMSPVVVTALIAVIFFVAVVVIFILSGDDGRKGTKTQTQTDSVASQGRSGVIRSETAVTSGTLKPDDLEFWSMFADGSESGDESGSMNESSAETETQPQDDPATDGKHTLVRYNDGSEEWVLINPYLQKHGYDFTRLVCQADLMKYFVNGKQASFVGIDVSKYQENLDFGRLKKAGIQFVMIRLGARGYGSGLLSLDDKFDEHMKKATEAGLDVGVYFSSQAINEDEAVEEANMVIEHLADYKISYPVAFDMGFVVNDTARTDKLSKAQKTAVTKKFLETVRDAGFQAILYGDKEWLIKEIDLSKLKEYDVWLSQIGDIPDYPYRFSMWQYKNDVVLDGIDDAVNLNISFVDYREK